MFKNKLLLALLIFGVAAEAQVDIEEIGGSNVIMSDIGNYAQATASTSASLWASELRPLFATYHQYRQSVNQSLQTNCNNGQNKVAFMLWFGPFDPGLRQTNIIHFAHVVDSSSYGLAPQVNANIRDVLMTVGNLRNQQNRPCYNEIQFRFAPQGPASPEHPDWLNGWREDLYQPTWHVVYYTTRLIRDTLRAYPHIKLKLDLGVELGGADECGYSTTRQCRPFTRRLWSDFISTFQDPSISYGFSIAFERGRVANFLRDMISTGHGPSEVAIDVYTEIKDRIVDAHDEMKTTGFGHLKILIQETFYDNQESAKQIQAAIELGAPIRTVMQWPNTLQNMTFADGSNRHIDRLNTPQNFFYRNDWPKTHQLGIGEASSRGVWLSGSRLSNGGCTVNLWTTSWQSLGSVSRDQTVCSANLITFRLPAETLSHSNIIVSVTDGTGKWTEPKILDVSSMANTTASNSNNVRTQSWPSISRFGLGGPNNTGVWVSGLNLSTPGCVVNIWSANWQPLGQVASDRTNCQSSEFISFTIPEQIKQNHEKIIFSVSNSRAEWSEPVELKIN
jgi:hypothetical protein